MREEEYNRGRTVADVSDKTWVIFSLLPKEVYSIKTNYRYTEQDFTYVLTPCGQTTDIHRSLKPRSTKPRKE